MSIIYVDKPHIQPPTLPQLTVIVKALMNAGAHAVPVENSISNRGKFEKLQLLHRTKQFLKLNKVVECGGGC